MARSALTHYTLSSAIAVAATLASCSTATRSADAPLAATVQVVVDATELAAAFEQDETAALDLFGGKLARVRGQLARIEALPDAKAAVTFRTSIETFRPVRCILDGADAIQFKLSENLTVIGKVVGFNESKYFITIDDCVVDQ